MPTRLIELVEKLQSASAGGPRGRVVLVGDFMMDRYLYGNAERLSPEAPVPVLHFQMEEFRLGGAGGVAADLAALGARVRAVGVVGADEIGRRVREHLAACGVETGALIEEPDRPTVCKVRLVGLAQHRHPQQMMRLDFEDPSPMKAESARLVIERVAALLDDAADILCLEDYNKGLLTPDVCRQIIELARRKNVPVLVDPANIPDYQKYAGATALKMNRIEAAKASGLPVESPEHYAAAGSWLVDNLGLDAAVVTLDKNGAYL